MFWFASLPVVALCLFFRVHRSKTATTAMQIQLVAKKCMAEILGTAYLSLYLFYLQDLNPTLINVPFALLGERVGVRSFAPD